MLCARTVTLCLLTLEHLAVLCTIHLCFHFHFRTRPRYLHKTKTVMGNQNVVRGAAGLSVFFGILALAASSLFLNEWRKPYGDCSTYDNYYDIDFCKPLRHMVTGPSLAIVASLIQIGSSVLAFIKKGKIWALIQQSVVLIFLVAAFVLPLSEQAQYIEDMDYWGYSVHRWIVRTFIAVTGLDALVTLIVTPLAFMYS